MAYKIIVGDTKAGAPAVLCYALTQEEAQEIVADLREQQPELQFGIVAEEEGE